MTRPIRDADTQHAEGAQISSLEGRTVVAVYEIPDSDRGESLLHLDNGQVLLLSCDPALTDDCTTRTPERWECVLYDATDTRAGRMIRRAS